MEKKMKTVLILGGYGFLGTNILKYVDARPELQYRFIVFDKFAKHQGGVVFNSVTKTYAGHDFESEEIENRLRSYEEKYIDDYEEDDPETAEQRAWEEYLKDKTARQALKEKRNQ